MTVESCCQVIATDLFTSNNREQQSNTWQNARASKLQMLPCYTNAKCLSLPLSALVFRKILWVIWFPQSAQGHISGRTSRELHQGVLPVRGTPLHREKSSFSRESREGRKDWVWKCYFPVSCFVAVIPGSKARYDRALSNVVWCVHTSGADADDI